MPVDTKTVEAPWRCAKRHFYRKPELWRRQRLRVYKAQAREKEKYAQILVSAMPFPSVVIGG